jgi:glycosyltransferase involved in cell wall biosynthesis
MSQLVSIVTPTFNRRHQVLQALKSIANQSYPQPEAILRDGAIQDSGDIVRASVLKRSSRERRAIKVVSMRGGKKFILVRVDIEHARPRTEQCRVSEAIAVRGGIDLAPTYPA